MTAITFEEMRTTAEHTAALRKFRNLLVFVAPMTASPVLTLTDATGQFLQLPEDYLAGAVGLIAKDPGITWPRDVTTSETESVNHGTPIRKDTESDAKQIKFTAQQTTKTVLELAYGLDLSAVTRGTNGEVAFAHPELPDDVQRRMLILGLDPKWKIGAGRFLPCVEPTDFPEISWSPTSETSYEITGDLRYDSDLGYSLWDIPVCGPGAITHAETLGFAAPAGP